MGAFRRHRWEVQRSQLWSGLLWRDVYWIACKFTLNQVVSVLIYITLHNKPNKRGDFWAKCVLKRQGRGLLRRDDRIQGSIFGLNKKLFVYLKPFCTHLLQRKTIPRWQHQGHELLLSPSSAFHSSSERFELLLQYPAKITLYISTGHGACPSITTPDPRSKRPVRKALFTFPIFQVMLFQKSQDDITRATCKKGYISFGNIYFSFLASSLVFTFLYTATPQCNIRDTLGCPFLPWLLAVGVETPA